MNRSISALLLGLLTPLFGQVAVSSTAAAAECDLYHGNVDVRSVVEQSQTSAYYDLDTEKGVRELVEAESMLACMSELVPTSDLTSLYLQKGALFLDLKDDTAAEIAIARAASVSARIRYEDPNLNKATRMAFLTQRDAGFLKDRPTLSFTVKGDGMMVAIDGQPIAIQGLNTSFVAGDHFVQVGVGGHWIGTWVTFPAGGQHTLMVTATTVMLGTAPAPSAESPPPTLNPAAVDTASPSKWRLEEGVHRNAAIGLGAAAFLPGVIWAAEEVAYRANLLSPDGVQVPSYELHYVLHAASGATFLLLGAGAATSVALSRLKNPSVQETQTDEKVKVSLGLSPRGFLLSGTF